MQDLIELINTIQIYISQFKMYLKQKIIKEKREEPKISFNLQVSNYHAIPTLVTFNNQTYRDKQNVLNHLNKSELQTKEVSKSNELQSRRSVDFDKKFNISINEEQLRNQIKEEENNKKESKLRFSHNFANFRKKENKNLYQSTDFNEHLTFGPINPIKQEKKLMTNRDFYEQKRLKTQQTNSIIPNTKSVMSKSSNELPLSGPYNCANHLTKQAKYRLVSELVVGEHELFYCSKCAINLLQQGFKIQQIRKDDDSDANQINQTRLQQITKLELKLKSLEDKTVSEIQKHQHQQSLHTIQLQIKAVNRQFSEIIQMIQQLRNQKIEELKEVSSQIEHNKKVRRQQCNQIAKDIQCLQSEIKDYKTTKKLSLMKEDGYQFMISSLANKIHHFEELVHTVSTPDEPPNIVELNDISQICHLLQERFSLTMEGEAKKLKQQIFNRQTLEAKRQTADDFICNQNRPFRILFPAEEKRQGITHTQNQKKIIIGMRNSYEIRRN